jgi:hypothetical protein
MSEPITLREFAPVLNVLGIHTEGAAIFEVVITAKMGEAVTCDVKQFIKTDTDKLIEVCKRYELIEKPTK